MGLGLGLEFGSVDLRVMLSKVMIRVRASGSSE